LPNTAEWRDIAKIYELAFKLNCKGITIFRDGSKDPALQVGTKKVESKDGQTQAAATPQVPEANVLAAEARLVNTPRQRPDVVHGSTYKINTNQGTLFVTVNEDEKGPFEVFLQGVGKSGSFTSSFIEAIGRLVSMLLRSGIGIDDIIGQLQGIRAGQPTMNPKGVFVYSVPDAVAKILRRHMAERKEQIKMFDPAPQPVQEVMLPKVEEEKVSEPEVQSVNIVVEEIEVPKEEPAQSITTEDVHSHYSEHNTTGDLLECPECGGDLEYAEGCILCRSCGFSRCG